MTAKIISPARRAAFDVLLRVELERSFSSTLLPIAEEHLSVSDRALCHELTLGTLRRQMKLDRIIDHFANGKKIDPAIRIALRLGFYQLKYLDRIPYHSAINESVNLAVYAKKISAKGFVNAILRRSLREPVELKYADGLDEIATETSHPRWLLEKWVAQFGLEKAKSICIGNNEIPNLSFRLTKKDTNLDLSSFKRSKFTTSFISETLTPDLRSAAQDGGIYFQDEGSILIADVAAAFEPARFLDVCAAPGGKTGRSALGANTIIAGDLRWDRTLFLQQNLLNQGVKNAYVVQYNAANALPFRPEVFDSVLVDAPCSGTGTIRHNPELRYLIDPNDLNELPHKQLAILKNASKMLAKDGILIYSTCSLEVEENENVCGRFLSEHINFEIIKPEIPDHMITDHGYGRTFPDRDNIDGFFIAVFRRNK